MMTGIFYLFLIFSIIGWCIEVVYAFIKKGHFVNRGFLNGPLCPIYGIGISLIYLAIEPFAGSSATLSETASLMAVFGLIFIITTALEFVTGYLLEKLFHTRWWDYSDRKFNIRGYVCMSFSLYWGLSGTAIVFALKRIFGSIDINYMVNDRTVMLSYFLMAGLLTDILFTIRSMVSFRSIVFELEKSSRFIGEVKLLMDALRPNLGNYVKIREYKKRFEDRLQHSSLSGLRTTVAAKARGYQANLNRLSMNRLYKAFPDMKINFKRLEEKFINYVQNRKYQ